MIRADPESRLPGRFRRSYGILADVGSAWRLTAQAMLRRPGLLIGVAMAWGVVRFLCLAALQRSHLALSTDDATAEFERWNVAKLMAIALLVDFGPVLVATAVLPPLYRLSLAAPVPGGRVGARRIAATFGVLMGMAMSLSAAWVSIRLGPALLIRPLGRTSTLLTMILVLPVYGVLLVALLRLSFGLPAIALGLPRPLSEAWVISRCHVVRTGGIVLLAGLPLVLAGVGWFVLNPDPLGLVASLVRPGLDVIAVALTASLTAVFYRSYRLPYALRPDQRPSRNRTRRRDPVVQ
jgi:hypothetical protein